MPPSGSYTERSLATVPPDAPTGMMTPAQIDYAFLVTSGQPPPAGLGAALFTSCQRLRTSDGRRANSDLAAGQCHDETDGWTSDIARRFLNPAGLGAEDDDPTGGAHRFATIEAGMDAFIAHVIVYNDTAPPPEIQALDGRYTNAVQAGVVGIAKDAGIAAYSGTWASNLNYAKDIAARTNRLVKETRPLAGLAEPTAAALGAAVQIKYTDLDYTEGHRALGAIRHHVVHDTQGWWPSDRDYLYNNDRASATWVIAPDGTLVYMVPLDYGPWTGGNGAYNEDGIHYELSGWEAYGYTHAQYQSLAAAIVWSDAQLPAASKPPIVYVGRTGAAGILAHSDIPNPNPPNPDPKQYCGPWGGRSCHTDPGPRFDWTKLVGLIAARQAAVGGTTAVPEETVRHFPETGHNMHLGFLSFYKWLAERPRGEAPAELLTSGYPLTDELGQADADLTLKPGDAPVAAVQILERATYLYEPANSAPWDVHYAKHWQSVGAIIAAIEAGRLEPSAVGLDVVTTADGRRALAVRPDAG